MSMDEERIMVEEERTFTAGRLVAAAALVAGVGLAAWCAISASRRSEARNRMGDLRQAAKRAWEHPDRIARGSGKTVGRKFLETFVSTAAKALAGRAVLALFETSLRRPGSESEVVDFPLASVPPLPA